MSILNSLINGKKDENNKSPNNLKNNDIIGVISQSEPIKKDSSTDSKSDKPIPTTKSVLDYIKRDIDNGDKGTSNEIENREITNPTLNDKIELEPIVVRNNMINVFNKQLPILSGYINKPFVYIPEDFYFLYSSQNIYYGDRIAGTHKDTQVKELLVCVLLDILGFNNIMISAHNNKDFTQNYKQIICSKLDKIGYMYVKTILNYYQKSFGIDGRLAQETMSSLFNNDSSIYVTPVFIKTPVYKIYKDVLEKVASQFNIEQRAYPIPLEIQITTRDKLTSYTNAVITQKEDMYKELYPVRLERYENYYRDNPVNNPDGQNQQYNKGSQSNQSKQNLTEEQLKELLDNNLRDLNNVISENYSSLEDEVRNSILIDVSKEPNKEWKSQLKEWINYYKPKKVNSYMNPNRKLLYTGMILSSPMTVKGQKDMTGINIYIDVSMSIDTEKITHAVMVLKSILEGYKGTININTFNTKVMKSDINLNKIRNGRVRLDLGGGTDIKAVLSHIESGGFKEYINIIITDGKLDWDSVKTMKKNNYKMAFLLTKHTDTTTLPKGRNLKVYEVV